MARALENSFSEKPTLAEIKVPTCARVPANYNAEVNLLNFVISKKI